MERGRAKLILNPISGRGAGLMWQERIVSHFKQAGYVPSVCVTQRKGDARRAAAELDSDCALVVVIGGDGTLNEVVNGLNADVPIGLVPLGGANLVARELGLPLEIPAACVAAAEGRPRRWDVGLANGRRFLLMAGLGWDAYAVQRIHRRRSGPVSRVRYLTAAAEGLWRYEFPRIQLELDDSLATWGYVVVVGNARGYAGPVELTSLAEPDDGLLDVVIWKKRRWLELLWHVCWACRERLYQAPGIEYRRCRKLTATSEARVPCQVDGDPAGQLPCVLEVVPGAVKLVAPDTE